MTAAVNCLSASQITKSECAAIVAGNPEAEVHMVETCQSRRLGDVRATCALPQIANAQRTSRDVSDMRHEPTRVRIVLGAVLASYVVDVIVRVKCSPLISKRTFEALRHSFVAGAPLRELQISVSHRSRCWEQTTLWPW